MKKCAHCDKKIIGKLYANLETGQYLCEACVKKLKEEKQKIKEELTNITNQVHRKVKKKVFCRDNNKCVCCGSIEKLELTHIVPLWRGYLTQYLSDSKEELYKILSVYFAEENLITLCKKCHSSFHSRYDKRNERLGRLPRKVVKKAVRDRLANLYGKDYKRKLENMFKVDGRVKAFRLIERGLFCKRELRGI